MVRAHSLLYAIYVCLIVSVLCGALLYIANLYNQLNLYYVTHEELYLHNQSLVNYSLGSITNTTESPEEETDTTGIRSLRETKQYGLLTLLVTRSFVKNDTVASAHFVGQYASDKTCVFLTDFSRPLSYSGTVKLSGEKKLPSENIKAIYIDNKPNDLTNTGETGRSSGKLPEINPAFRRFSERGSGIAINLTAIPRENDSIYYNSFLSETKEVQLPGSSLANIIIKGNFILHSNDSIRISSSAVLEDVILIAPKITFEDGFKGNVQAFATKGIEVGRNVYLAYPSVLCIYNTSIEESLIKIKQESRLYGSIVMFGVPFRSMEKNNIYIEENGFILGDIYCEGRLSLKSDVYGSVYTNKFLLQTPASKYENCIADIEINVNKRPGYFISIPLFDSETLRYGILKKVL